MALPPATGGGDSSALELAYVDEMATASTGVVVAAGTRRQRVVDGPLDTVAAATSPPGLWSHEAMEVLSIMHGRDMDGGTRIEVARMWQPS